MIDAKIEYECNYNKMGAKLYIETSDPLIDAAFQRGENNSAFLWYMHVINTENINYTYEIDGIYTVRYARLDGINVRFIDDQISTHERNLNTNAQMFKQADINHVAGFKMITFNKQPYDFINGDVIVSVRGEIYYCSAGRYYRALFHHEQLNNEIILKNTEITRDALVKLTGLYHSF